MASATDARRLIRNATYRLYGVINAVSTLCPINAALTGMDCEISKDGGAFADLAAAETDLGGGYFSVDIAATETACTYAVVQFKASNAGAVTFVKFLEFEECIDSGVPTAAASSSITLPATGPSTTDLVVGATIEIVRGTGAGQTRYVTAYASLVATVDRPWVTVPDTTSVYILKAAGGVNVGTDLAVKADMTAIYGVAAAASNLSALYKGGLIAATINDSTPSATQFDTTLVAGDGDLDDMLLVMTSGTLAGRAQKVSAFLSSSGSVTLYGTGLNDTPANGDSFVLLGKIL